MLRPVIVRKSAQGGNRGARLVADSGRTKHKKKPRREGTAGAELGAGAVVAAGAVAGAAGGTAVPVLSAGAIGVVVVSAGAAGVVSVTAGVLFTVVDVVDGCELAENTRLAMARRARATMMPTNQPVEFDSRL